MSEKAPICLECIHNIGDGLCYRKNNGEGIAQLTLSCSSREIYHNCATCNKKRGVDCNRLKNMGRAYCRVWVISPYFDLASKGGN